METAEHIPVLVDEVLALFKPKSGHILLDATLGQGGHARAYLAASAPAGRLFGIDADERVLITARERMLPFGERSTIHQGHFAYLKDSITGGGILQTGILSQFTHILFDLGVGSHQLADPERGFSFTSLKGLSMYFGLASQLPPAQLPALNKLERRLGYLPDIYDLLANLSSAELAEIIYVYGEERFRGRIATALKVRPYPLTGAQLAARVANAVPSAYRRGRLHPATRTFQALRLAVNRELESLSAALPQAYDLLAPGGIIAVISFHSLEDRIVKHTMRRYAAVDGAIVLTKKPISASASEISSNPRARSAKLRALQKRKSISSGAP